MKLISLLLTIIFIGISAAALLYYVAVAIAGLVEIFWPVNRGVNTAMVIVFFAALSVGVYSYLRSRK